MARSIDLTGQTFNRLTAIRRVTVKNRGHYECRCECGNIVIVNGSKLRSGATKSCGCLQLEKIKGNTYCKKQDGIAMRNRIINSYKGNAKRKNIIFSLTTEECESLFQSNCHYCGKPPSKVGCHKSIHTTYTYNGIDRIDNNQGYVTGNVVSCCTECNYRKNSSSYDDFITWITSVYHNLFNKELT